MRGILLLLMLVAPGCASYNKMEAPRPQVAASFYEREQAEQMKQAMTDHEIVAMLNMDVRPRLPANIAVARLDYNSLATMGGEELEGWREAAGTTRHIRMVQPLSRLYVPTGAVTLNNLRAAAAMQQCEMLLVYFSDSSSLTNYNDAAILYWTLIGLWVSPGTVYEHQTIMQAILVDCRTGMILGTATGESHEKRVSPSAYGQIQRDKLQQETPAKAMAALQSDAAELIARVCSFADESEAIAGEQ